MLKKLFANFFVAHAQILMSPIGMLIVAIEAFFLAILFPNLKKMGQEFYLFGFVAIVIVFGLLYGFTFYFYYHEKRKKN